MPPGGHVDPNELPEETAKRECKEETGLDVEIIGDAQENLFCDNADEGRMIQKPIALMLENIPACEKRGEPEHQHIDFLYLARVIDEKQPLMLDEREGTEIRWFTKEEIEKLSTNSEIFANVKHYIISMT